MDVSKFHYENTEIKKQIGGKTVRRVYIKNGKGYKSVTKYRRGVKVGTAKNPIHKKHVELIKKGTFIPGLFNDCKFREKNCKTKRNK